MRFGELRVVGEFGRGINFLVLLIWWIEWGNIAPINIFLIWKELRWTIHAKTKK